MRKTVKKGKKRRGRGYGSGRGGHTSSRGQKGQKSRTNLNILFEGVKFKKSYYKRLPIRRGKGKFKSQKKPLIVKLAYLEVFPSGSKVDIDSLVSKGVVRKADAEKYGVKILGDGEFKKKLTIEVPISKSAAKKIEKAGGKVLVDGNKSPKIKKKKESKKAKKAK